MNTLSSTFFSRGGVFLALSVLLLSACGGGSSAGSSSISIAGAVADGYLQGAKACLDLNDNLACDSGEPTATTGPGGSYSFSATEAQKAAHAVVVEVPATAIDEDTNTQVGQSFVLSAPAGKPEFVSPLSSLVHQAMLDNSSLSVDAAAEQVRTENGLSVAPLENYIAKKAATSDTTAQGNYEQAHKSAQVLANSLKANTDTAGTLTNADEKKAFHLGVLRLAKSALQSQTITKDTVVATATTNAQDATTLLALAKTGSASSASQAVTIAFDLLNGDTSVRCGDALTLTNLKQYDSDGKALTTPTSQTTVGKMIDTRFYVSEVRLYKEDGSFSPLVLDDVAGQYKGLSLLDFGNAADATGQCTASSTHKTSISGKVAAGDYTGLSLTIGVPVKSPDLTTKLNHSNQAAATTPTLLSSNGMEWNWQYGRKFMKLEFVPNSVTSIWFFHLGSIGCTGDPVTGKEVSCTNPNRLNLSFDAFNPSTQKVVLQLDKLYAGSDLGFFGASDMSMGMSMGGGCMSDPNDSVCIPLFKALGIGLTGANAGKTLSGDNKQTVFTVKAKTQ